MKEYQHTARNLYKSEKYHTELVEACCDADEELMMIYLDGEEPDIPSLKAALRKLTCEPIKERAATANEIRNVFGAFFIICPPDF